MNRFKANTLPTGIPVRLFAAILILSFAVQIQSQVPDEHKVKAAAEKVFSEISGAAPDGSPGCAIGVSRSGKQVFGKAFGLAELENGVPIATDSIFESGSVAKQFTAAALVLLENDGKLSIDDPVRKYIPELPDYGAPLTIRHILNHTAGVRDWGGVMALTGVGRGERIVKQNYALYVITKQKNLDFVPGTEYSYSNSGYTLAATIVERVTGKSFPEFTKERIFGPVGMANTSWRDDYERLVPKRVQAYAGPRQGPWKLSMPFMNVYGNGGILTTIGDFLKWNAALDSAEWKNVTDKLETQGVLNDGSKIRYALGLTVGDYHGLREVGHDGSTAGYVTYLARYPGLGVSTVVLCNARIANPRGVAHSIIDEIAGPWDEPEPVEVREASADELKRYVGVWRNTLTEMPIRTFVDPGNGELKLENTTLRPLKDGTFQLGNGSGRYKFETGPGGAVNAISSVSDGDNFRLVSEKEWTPSESELNELLGTWYSDESDADVRTVLKNGRLFIVLESLEELPLFPHFRDHFTVGPTSGIVVWVKRDKNGKLQELHVGASRMRDMPFRKK